MKKQITKFIILMFILATVPINIIYAQDLPDRLSGKILLQVEGVGQAWYIDPETKERAFLGRPADAFRIMRELGLGISEKDYNSFNGYAPSRLSGKILLRAEANGEAYYVFPDDLKMFYLGRPADAFDVMREKGLGITDEDLEKVPVFQKYKEKVEELAKKIEKLQGEMPGGETSREGSGDATSGEAVGDKTAPATGGTGFNLPSVNTSLSLPIWPTSVPKGEWVTKNLGDIEIRYFSTAIIWGMTESGTDVFITLKNKGASQATVNFTPVEDLLEQVPKWNLHFFSLQEPPLTLRPGEEKKLWYFASIDQEEGTFTVKFKLWLGSDSVNYAEVPVVFGAVQGNFYGKETSLIYGYVKDENGNPLAGIGVDAQINCGRLGFRSVSDSQGRYYLSVLGQEDIDAIYQGKELGCASTDYFLTAEKDGYEFYFKGQINPTQKNFARADIVLEKKKEIVSFALSWEKQVSEPYGFFWVKPSADWNYFAASQAKHEPQLGKPTNIYLFDSIGNIVWKQPTENECWGIDIAPDASKVVAGCHDEKVYAISKEGNVLWTYDAGTMVRSACISNDGKTALSGTVGNLFLFNATTGAKSNLTWPGSWLRNCLFYLDDSGFIAGSPEIGGFTVSGSQQWLQEIGEFPMFLGTDNAKNVFAAGKTRTLFSFDVSGNLRWKEKIPDHVVTTGAVTPDGSRIALGTIGGMVYLFDGQGNVLWKRNLGSGMGGDSAGHNAVAISPDGKRIVVGSAPGNCLMVYNEKGTIDWKKCITLGTIQADLRAGITNVQISPDKTKIIASYGDNYLREFIK